MRVGIDIGGMTTKLGVVDASGRITAKKVIPTDSGNSTPQQVIRRIADAVGLLLEESGITEPVEGMGVACPGTCDSNSGDVLYSNNLRWENVPLLSLLQPLKIPAAVANDADAAALAEVLFGAARGKKNAILLTLGTGVGAGVILDGKIYQGPLRGGCEAGHMVIVHGGKPCTCGRRGCLECYASATALMEAARDAAKEHPQSLLAKWSHDGADAIDGKMIFDAREQRDEAAAMVLESYEDYLSTGIANLINIFRPETVILGGGVSAQKEVLTDALQRKVGQQCFGGPAGETARIVTSVLGNDAGMIGAAYVGGFAG